MNKKQLKKIQLLLSTIIVFISCNTRTNKMVETSELDIKNVQEYEVIDSFNIPLPFNLWDWKIIDDNIVFFFQGTDHFCTVYNCVDTFASYDMARKGKNQDEYISCNWCKTKEKDKISLYDIMKKKIDIYNVGNKGFTKERTYSLPTDENGLTLPYTKMVHYQGEKFLLKEDGIETNLRLINLEKGNEIASFHCIFRDGKDEPYTPYDYLFHVIGNKIVIAYCYFDRIEILQIDENEIRLIASYGEDRSNITLPDNYDLLKYYNLYIETHDDSFYILRSLEGEEYGREILTLNAKKHEMTLINLPKPINAFSFDQNGILTGYNESDSGTIIYKFK